MPYTIEPPIDSKSKYTVEPPASTSLGGVEGSITRGIAPMAAGAGLGAAIGAPFAGVGAIPGAAAGAGAVGLTELTTGLYNRLAKHFGWPETATPQEMTDKVLDLVGVNRPSTGTERTAEAVAGGAAGALGPARAASDVATRLTTPAAKDVAESLAARPGLQTVSGALGGASGQLAAEAGAGPVGQQAASLIGSALPGYRATIAAEPRRQAMDSRQAGYVLPPKEFSDSPGLVSRALSGWGGKVKTEQDASAKNQEVTDRLAVQSLGLPPGTVLSDQVFKDVRDNASQAYKAVATSIPIVTADADYAKTLATLGGRNRALQQLFPKITKNPAVEELVQELQSVPQMPPDLGLELVRELRHAAKGNMRDSDPSKQSLGIAQREAAEAVDGLIERNIKAQTGRTDLVDAYRNARQMIARSHDVELATNIANGNVNSRVLARLAIAGKPLTGELETIAKTAAAFPKSTQPPAGFGHPEALSVLDVIGAGAAALSGHGLAAGMLVGRPVARATVLSGPYQRAMSGQSRTDTSVLPLLMNPGGQAIVPPGVLNAPNDSDTMRRAASP